ncbi:Uncharacterised protein [Mycobacterium tuberculosis]|nr:Uncharacterised protein [Mycobacterium tuberculosis]
MSRLLAMCSALAERNTAALPNCRFHRSSTCAGVLPYWPATDVTVGWSISRPRASGV